MTGSETCPRSRTSQAVCNPKENCFSPVLAEIGKGTEYLKPPEVRRFVRRISEEIGKLTYASHTYGGLSELADAQARLGDYPAARKSALSIGQGPTATGYDPSDG